MNKENLSREEGERERERLKECHSPFQHLSILYLINLSLIFMPFVLLFLTSHNECTPFVIKRVERKGEREKQGKIREWKGH